MQQLPIDEAIPQILAAAGTGAVVVRAAPGSGKTTRIPPALAASGLLASGQPNVLVLEPRRIAARAAAARIAQERGWKLGREVGYQVRFDKRISEHTRIRFLTEGILTRQLAADPFLETTGAIVIDEFHERSLDADLAIALVHEIRGQVRGDLIVVVASATLAAEPVARYLGGCPIIDVPGALHPVELDYRPTERRQIDTAIAAAVQERIADPTDRRHILVFLPGMAEIRRAAAEINRAIPSGSALVLPLHGSMTPEEQDRVLAPSNTRKVILATNVAETSLTIEGVGTVIDTGLARLVRHEPARGVDRHEIGAISQASAVQRAGRAGRTGPGRCIRLYSERDFLTRPAHEIPEIHRVDLSGAMLLLESFGAAPETLAWYEPPDPERVRAAVDLLRMLGAVAGTPARITPIGQALIELPVSPRLGRLLVEAENAGRIRAGATLAAILSEPDFLRRDRPPPVRSRSSSQDEALSDVLYRLDLFEQAERARFAQTASEVDPLAARKVARVRDELLRRLGRNNPIDPSGDEQELLEWLLVAYPDRLVKSRGAAGTGLMVGGRGARLANRSLAHAADLYLAIDAREVRERQGLEIAVEIASPVRLEWLERRVPHLLERKITLEFDASIGRVAAANRLVYRDLVLREDTSAKPPLARAGEILFQALRSQAESIARANPSAAQLLERLRFVRSALPELDWPALDDHWFESILEEICAGEFRRDAVEQADWAPRIENTLSPMLRRELRDSAPESLKLPNGRTAKFIYGDNGPPVLAAKVQDLFGWSDTPRLARGRIPVVLHLLAPSGRPVQITTDLRSFWANTYPQVRKDLRGRYPKHAWPEDPRSGMT